MAKKFYTIEVENTPAFYASDYFPRRMVYLKEAVTTGEDAISKGATKATIKYPDGRILEITPSQAKDADIVHLHKKS